jgi:hypothetical protein
MTGYATATSHWKLGISIQITATAVRLAVQDARPDRLVEIFTDSEWRKSEFGFTDCQVLILLSQLVSDPDAAAAVLEEIPAFISRGNSADPHIRELVALVLAKCAATIAFGGAMSAIEQEFA